MSLLRFKLVWLLGLLPVVVIAAANVYPTTDATTTMCKRIESQLPGRISYPGNTVFTNSLSSYYSAQERELDPGCVFTPNSTADVSHFVKLITTNGGATPQFAIRSGGHKYFAGAANIDKGITVDMRGIHEVKFNHDFTVASIGGGAVWSEDVYPYLVAHNLTAAGARLPGIGIGGFVTGGGLTFVARRNGWACDTMVGYEVVLASGEVVIATASSYRDLWLALKGGSNNFGIVTHFFAATYPQGHMLGGVIAFNYTRSVLDAEAKAFSNFMKPENFDEKAMMGVLITYEGGVSGIANSLFYLDPNPSPAVYKPFFSIPGQIGNNLVVADVGTIVNDFGSFTPKALARAAEITYSFKNGDASVYSELFRIYNDTLPVLLKKNIPGSGVQWLTQPQAVSNGTNSLGLPPNENDLVNVDIVVGWNNAADDAFMMAFLNSLKDKHIAALIRKGVYIPFTYLNYAGKSQDPISSYGHDSKKQLQTVSKKYDPTGIFQTKVPGGFKLFP